MYLVALFEAVLCASVAHGQIPERLQRCLPYPTFAEEINALTTESIAAADKSSSHDMAIDQVILDPPTGLSNPAREEFLDQIKHEDPNVGADSIGERAREAWQDQGYFKVQATADFRTVASDSTTRHVALTVHVDEGPQYFLGDIEIRSSDPDEPLVFAPDELRKLVPLREGDVFDASKIRQALEVFRRLYGSHGYIDLNVEPEFDVNDSSHTIALVLQIDQQEQFHFGSVEILGLDSATEKALKNKIKSGDTFDINTLTQFLEENKLSLPTDASLEDVDLKRNAKTGTVDLRFDFFRCPEIR